MPGSCNRASRGILSSLGGNFARLKISSKPRWKYSKLSLNSFREPIKPSIRRGFRSSFSNVDSSSRPGPPRSSKQYWSHSLRRVSGGTISIGERAPSGRDRSQAYSSMRLANSGHPYYPKPFKWRKRFPCPSGFKNPMSAKDDRPSNLYFKALTEIPSLKQITC